MSDTIPSEGFEEFKNLKMGKIVKCWEALRCKEQACPAYKSRNLKCWLFSGTHCRQEIQGMFLEKMEMCFNCKVFKANMSANAMKKTLRIVDRQFMNFKELVEKRDRELESISMELALDILCQYSGGYYFCHYDFNLYCGSALPSTKSLIHRLRRTCALGGWHRLSPART